MATHQDTDRILISVKDLYFQKEKNHQHVEKLGLMHVKVEETLILVLMLTCVKHTLQKFVLQPSLLIPTNRHLHSSNLDKLSYKLNRRVLNPTNLEKTNVSLACSIFDETTISACKFYRNSSGVITFLNYGESGI